MSLVYLDSSALVKLFSREPETEALRSYLKSRPHRVASALTRLEVARALRRSGAAPGAHENVEFVLSRVILVKLDSPILEVAATLDPPELRSLDAIHLATALGLQEDLEALVTYDVRLAAGAEALDLPVASPE